MAEPGQMRKVEGLVPKWVRAFESRPPHNKEKMVKRTGPTNQYLVETIDLLRKKSINTKEKIWKRIAKDLEKPTRSRRAVNLSKINMATKENELVVVPGKVLGSGELKHPLTIAAWNFSDGALEKMKQARAKAIYINELMNDNAKGKRIRIIG